MDLRTLRADWVEQGANERWIHLFGERKKESKKPNLCHDLF